MLGIKRPGHLLALYSFWLFCLMHGSAKTPFSAATDRLAGFMLVAREKTDPILKCELGTCAGKNQERREGHGNLSLQTCQQLSDSVRSVSLLQLSQSDSTVDILTNPSPSFCTLIPTKFSLLSMLFKSHGAAS